MRQVKKTIGPKIGDKEPIHRLAVMTLGGRLSAADIEADRLQLEQRLHAHLDQRCIVTRKRNQVFIDIAGVFSGDELDHMARGVLRVWEWEAA
jgi:hypothetical protein